jgi:hypothetical protein
VYDEQVIIDPGTLVAYPPATARELFSGAEPDGQFPDGFEAFLGQDEPVREPLSLLRRARSHQVSVTAETGGADGLGH